MKTKTKQEKFDEFQKEFNQKTNKTKLQKLGVTAFAVIFLVPATMITIINIVPWVLPIITIVEMCGLLYIIIFLYTYIPFCSPWRLDSESSVKTQKEEAKEDLKEERELLQKLNSDYSIIKRNGYTLNNIPADLRDTVQYLLNSEKTPEEVIEEEEVSIEDLEIKLEVYSNTEPTFWKYFWSFTWLKKATV
ncbi:MAG: hypothetical protein WC606_02665 [Candidatus Absconditabacterales bacterium]|jgi:hypothetical protein